ncbi:hypothetical protein H8L32_15310 [Undibacterium sp. CY18W]|uniref:SMODS and SLOG-associating 2TM effector domain-containing protein n=1 Tax=Undibacterium hunanense TaxID=2762292 RepID=A0ABR6ZSM2_9BURK|nr:hypothetical protein [Undibacterium hunanense]MBC3918858.1 hypothetical protein [Undibacterium hunanense]
MLEMIYTQYLKIVTKVGMGREENAARSPALGLAHDEADNAKFTYEESDAKALLFGNRYRGLGLTVGLLAICVMFCAIAPYGFVLSHEDAWLFGTVELGLLIVMSVLILHGSRSRLRQDWIKFRRIAEAKRYEFLNEQIDIARTSNGLANMAEVAENVRHIVDDQREYNQSKAKLYHNVHHAGNLFSWASLALGIVGGGVHVIGYEAHWLIFLTTFAPAVAGIVHGIHNFLRIDKLAEAHELTAEYMQEILQKLDQISGERQGDDLADLAELTRTLLTHRDVEWSKQAERLDIKPI